MPEIDLTEVILNGEVAGERFTVVRRLDVVAVDGVTTIVNAQYPAIGQITPTGANSLLREAEFSAANKTIRVTTNFMLQGPSNFGGLNYQPDIVLWNGDSYIVRSIDDFSKFGFGMITAECSSIDWVDNPPTPNPANRLLLS